MEHPMQTPRWRSSFKNKHIPGVKAYRAHSQEFIHLRNQYGPYKWCGSKFRIGLLNLFSQRILKCEKGGDHKNGCSGKRELVAHPGVKYQHQKDKGGGRKPLTLSGSE